MNEGDDGSGVTHGDIRSAIRWMSWALTGLGGVGAFALYTMQGRLDDSTSALGRIEKQVEKSIDGLSGTIEETNSVLQATALKLEGISRIVERNTETIRDHNSKDADRAHPK